MTTPAPSRPFLPLLLLLPLLGALAACGAPPAAASADAPQARREAPPDPRAALLLADGQLAAEIAREGWGALPRWLADGAAFLPPDSDILVGERAIRAWLRANAADPAALATALHQEAGGASADGELGYTFGWLDATAVDGTVSYGKYVASWRRHGGRWQVAALMHSPAVKAPTAPPVDSPLLAGYHGTPPGHPRGDQRRGVMAADRAFAAEALALAPVSGYGQAFVDWADPGAVVFGGRNFYWGIDWVKAIYLTTVAGEYLTWGPTQGDAAESGDLGWTIGTAAYHFSDPSGTYDDYETYLTIWARQADGSWRWLLDDGNLRPAPTP